MPRSSRPTFSPARPSSSSLQEHLDTGDRGLGGGRADADDLDLVDLITPRRQHGHHGATTGDGEDVLDGHQEQLVGTLGLPGSRIVDRVHEGSMDGPLASPSRAFSADC